MELGKPSDYDRILDLYKFYWSVAIRVSGFYIVAIGAALSFFVTNGDNYPKEITQIPKFCFFLSLLIAFLAIQAGQDLKSFRHKYKFLYLDSKLTTSYAEILAPLQYYLLGILILCSTIAGGCVALSPSLLTTKAQITYMVLAGISFVGAAWFIKRI